EYTRHKLRQKEKHKLRPRVS
ncbi:hypothetical protein Pmani_039183, partial [Petrolisthes manimaculis]